jgi:PAS domain S-box-containing protein
MNNEGRMRFSKMDSIRADQMDFVPRERQTLTRTLVLAFALAAATIFIAAYTPVLGANAIYAPLIAILLVALLGLYAVYHAQRATDLVMAAEYQTMLFTQAFSLGSSFGMIVRRDGTIIYASDGVKNVFPHFDYAQSQVLEGIFEQGTVRKIDRDRIMNAIHSKSNERLVFSVMGQYTEKKDYIMTVEPLPRPSGFCMLRGREYLGQRSGLTLLPDSLHSTSIEKVEALLSTTQAALYATDAYGKFEYVNPAFEQLFGYAAGEIIESKLSLHHLFFSFGAATVTEEYGISNYSGSTTIIRNHGVYHQAVVNQNALRDPTGKVTGAVGTLVALGTQ